MKTATRKKRTAKKTAARKPEHIPKHVDGVLEIVPEINPAGQLATVEHSPAMGIIDKLIANPDFDMDKMDRLLAVQERWEENEARKAYNAAFSKFKALNVGAVKTEHVRYQKKDKTWTDYWHDDVGVTLHNVGAAMGPLGLAIRFATKHIDGLIYVAAICSHSLGHSERAELPAAPDTSGGKNDIQAVGSTIRYLQRYTLNMLLGLAPPGDPNEGHLPISAEEVDEINAALERKQKENPGAANWSTERFCNWLGVGNVESIPRIKYRKVALHLQLGKASSKAGDLQSKTEGA